MKITQKRISASRLRCHRIVLAPVECADLKRFGVDENEHKAILEETKDNTLHINILTRGRNNIYIVSCKSTATLHDLRKAGSDTHDLIIKKTHTATELMAAGINSDLCHAFLEGFVLNDYAFDKYKSKKVTHIESITIDSSTIGLRNLDISTSLWHRINICRNWVNEPVISLNAPAFANILKKEAKEIGVSCTVLGQKQIESLKMGGLLAVNRGSVDEARVVILEHKPSKSKNSKPIVLVGKGIMYDTGGLNIKPDEYMREMKSDMAGAATMASVLFAAAERKMPLHLIAVLPLTDNRPGFNAYAADDIITMFDGSTVEVVNTDAEGRLILADALAYAKRFKPSLVIDAATLTGAAARAIGPFGIAMMQKDATATADKLRTAGEETHERVVEFPMWDEYDELIKSDVADVKNCGTAQAGCITAAKFLARFTDYPYVHLDIAGVAFFDKKVPIYGVGASAYGMRLLMNFLEKE